LAVNGLCPARSARCPASWAPARCCTTTPACDPLARTPHLGPHRVHQTHGPSVGFPPKARVFSRPHNTVARFLPRISSRAGGGSQPPPGPVRLLSHPHARPAVFAVRFLCTLLHRRMNHMHLPQSVAHTAPLLGSPPYPPAVAGSMGSPVATSRPTALPRSCSSCRRAVQGPGWLQCRSAGSFRNAARHGYSATNHDDPAGSYPDHSAGNSLTMLWQQLVRSHIDDDTR
jgi:hypothetical protein